jgi:hypothetical protein
MAQNLRQPSWATMALSRIQLTCLAMAAVLFFLKPEMLGMHLIKSEWAAAMNAIGEVGCYVALAGVIAGALLLMFSPYARRSVSPYWLGVFCLVYPIFVPSYGAS